MITIKAHFDGKVLVLDEPANLPINQPLLLYIAPLTESTETCWDVLDRYAGTIDAPSDWSAEHDHYLYGTPKRNQPAPPTDDK